MREAHKRGFPPHCVAFDGWCLPNLKLLRSFDWTWLRRLKENRLVNPDGTGVVSLSQVEIGENGRILHLTGYGLSRVFRLVSRDGDTEYWATNDVQMTDLTRVKWASYAWAIENYHRGIKQFTGVERCQARAARAAQSYWAGIASLFAFGDALLLQRDQLV